MNLKSIIIFSSLIVIIAFPVQGVRRKWQRRSTSPRKMPTVEQILDEYVQAIGGETAHKKLLSTGQNLR
jgi:hypothetical protein